MGSLKLSFTVQWKPFKGEDLPMCSSGLSAGYADLEPPPIPDGPVSADNVSTFYSSIHYLYYINYSLNNIYYFNNYFKLNQRAEIFELQKFSKIFFNFL